jgi:hypothetical protein
MSAAFGAEVRVIWHATCCSVRRSSDDYDESADTPFGNLVRHLLLDWFVECGTDGSAGTATAKGIEERKRFDDRLRR